MKLPMSPAWLASVALAGIAASFTLWDPLEVYERAHVARSTRQSMESLRADLRSDVKSRLLAQVRLAELWVDYVAVSPREQETSCRLFLEHHAGYVALEWAGPTYRVMRTFGSHGPAVSGVRDDGTERALRALWTSASAPAAHEPVITPSFPLPDGRPALRVVVPVVRHDGSTEGFLVAVADLRATFDSMLDDHKDLGFSVSIEQNGGEIYRMPGSVPENKVTLEEEGVLPLPGATWTVCVWPKPEIVANMRSVLPRLAMLLGGLLGAVLMLAVHYGRSAQRTSQALRRAHDQLEQRVKERTLDLQHANKSLQTEVIDRKRAEESYRRLSGRLLQLQDEERRRIARDLHDSTAQMLGALAINMDRARVLSDQRDQARLARVLDESGRFVEDVTQEIRTVSYLLHPPMLDDLGLEYVLPWYADGFGRRSGIEVSLDVQPDIGRLPREIELTLFRIAQEALANVYRHSGSASVAIALCRDGDSVTLEVSDRGVGLPQATLDAFLHATPTAPMGVGIAGMRERVRQLHGEMGLASDSGGTTIRTVLPITQATGTGVVDWAPADCGPQCGRSPCPQPDSSTVCEARA